MANDDRERRDRASLEPPSLGFSRRRRRQRDVPPPATPAPLDPAAEPPAGGDAVSHTTPTTFPGSAVPPTEPADVDETPTTAVPPAASTEPGPAAGSTAERLPRDPGPTPMAGPETHRPLFADEAAPAPRHSGTDTVADLPPAGHTEPTQPDPRSDNDQSARPRHERTPLLTGVAAAVFTGAFIGVLVVGLTAGSMRLCELVRGTSSCGGPGFFLLVAILVALVLLGGVLLRAFRVPDPGSTSFLAVGLLTVVVLLFLVDVLFVWWMILVIPVCSAATFALSHWVTSTFTDTDAR